MEQAHSQFMELVEWDWCELPNGNHLHGIRRFSGEDDLVPVGGAGVTACGRSGRLSIPGLFARMDAQRCMACCTALGYPRGVGSPKNGGDEIRALIEARLRKLERAG